MALNAKTAPGGGGNRNFEPMDPGTYPARLVQVVDVGLQNQRPFNGQEKTPAREIMFTYEFVDEFMLDEDGQELQDKPRWLSEFIALYNLDNERAKSTARYKALDPTLSADGDFAQLVDTAINVTIVQNPGKGKNAGKIFENIAGTSTMREKDARRCPELKNETVVFDLDEPDLKVFLGLPRFVQDKIKANLEFAGSKLEGLLEANAGGPGKKATEDASTAAEQNVSVDDNDNPY